MMTPSATAFSGRLAVGLGKSLPALLVLVVALIAPQARAADDELVRLQQENAALNQQVAALREELTALRAQLAELRQDKDQLTNQAQQLEQETQQLQQLAGVATDGRIEAEQSARISRETDAQTQLSRVSFGPEPLDVEGAPGEVYFSMDFSYPADAPPAAARTVRFFIQAYRTGKHFQGDDPVQWVIDGQRVDLIPDDYDLTSRRSGLPGRSRMDRSDEIVRFDLNRDLFARLSAAETLTVRRSSLRLAFDRDDLAALRAFELRLMSAVDAASTP